ncbi:MAG: prepilin-type cleavage/methylation domain-containing protein [Burkholderiales bacterium PBB6]|nr:MAG: prepilin-type cleavage/methylation domain-containing protein [Burkholderiales bacterium PBB6]
MNAKSLQALRPQSGFTLIELVMVIVILAVLAAVAIPKFVDLGADAKTAALAGVAGSLTSAASVNYAARKVNINNGVVVTDCDHVKNALQGGVPNGYNITPRTITAGEITAATAIACSVTQTSTGVIATFTAVGIN